MANKYDDSEGVWRTIGGRRVFIRTGQSLSDAMKESGKFKKSDLKKNTQKYEKELEKEPNHQAEEAHREFEKEFEKKKEEARVSFEKNEEKIKNMLKDPKEIDSKSVMDSDGFYTDYTLYEMPNGKYKAVFGDKEVYGADADADMEFDTLKEAQEWFDDYKGFDEEDNPMLKYSKDIMVKDANGKEVNAYDNIYDMDRKQAQKYVQDLNNQGQLSKEDYDTLKDFVGFEDEKPKSKFPTTEEAVANLENARKAQAEQQAQWDKQVADAKAQFDVSELKKKAQEVLPKEDIDTHYGDLYLKKTPKSEALINNMKDADSDLITTFKDQQTGETWYDVPFGNWEDNYKEQTSKNKEVNFKDFDAKRDLQIGDTYIDASGSLNKVIDRPAESGRLERKLAKMFVPNQQNIKGTKWEVEKLRQATDDDKATYPSVRNVNRSGEYTKKLEEKINNYNDKATATFGKVDYYGNGRKSNAVGIDMELKDGVFSASGYIKNARGTDWVSGGQNIDEIADMMKDNKDVQEIRDLWHKYHLNDMHAGTEKQEAALDKKFGGVNANKYDEQVDYLKSIGLYEDNGYKFGTGWLKREIPMEDKKRIVALIDKYNGKNDTSNDWVRDAFNQYKKEHPNTKITFDAFKKQNKK